MTGDLREGRDLPVLWSSVGCTYEVSVAGSQERTAESWGTRRGVPIPVELVALGICWIPTTVGS